MRLSRWSRITTQPQETPREITKRLHREMPDVQDLDYLGESFIRSRYGQKELNDSDKERLAKVWKQVRGTLFPRIFRLK
jgi:hypothetical protein